MAHTAEICSLEQTDKTSGVCVCVCVPVLVHMLVIMHWVAGKKGAYLMSNLLREYGSREALPISSAAQVNWLINIYKVIEFLKPVFLQNIKAWQSSKNFSFLF